MKRLLSKQTPGSKSQIMDVISPRSRKAAKKLPETAVRTKLSTKGSMIKSQSTNLLTKRDVPFKARKSPTDFRRMFHDPVRELYTKNYDMPTISVLKKQRNLTLDAIERNSIDRK